MKEELYIVWRLIKAYIQGLLFYLFRIFPIKKHKIVFTTIEGTTGFSCNPKYIALELIRRNQTLPEDQRYELVWLVNDCSKGFPPEIKKVKNTLWNRAYELTTAGFWIDNSRKQLECRKRKGQIYIQTWHAKLGFKPTCLDRGASFSKIAYLVSKHDSDMVDFWLSNSDWYDKTLKTGSLYEGKTIRSGSPRCDILILARDDEKFKQSLKDKITRDLALEVDPDEKIHYMMYAPTFRGGSQGTNRQLDRICYMPEWESLIDSLEKRFGGCWRVLLRLHPQMTVRKLYDDIEKDLEKSLKDRLIDISNYDDMYEFLAGCDAFMTDYSSAAFDAAVMGIPVFLYCVDYKAFEGERGKLLWNLCELPFLFSGDNNGLETIISNYDHNKYQMEMNYLFKTTQMVENGNGSSLVCDFINRC